jgi:hypothetical protein
MREEGCLYEENGVIGRLVELDLDDNPAKYDGLTDIINVGVEGSERVDPIDVYVSRQKCSCRIRHRQRRAPPAAVSDELLAKVDLKEALAMLESNRSA